MGNSKIFGLKNRYADYSDQQLKNVGVNRIMDTGGGNQNIPPGDKFALVKKSVGLSKNTTVPQAYQVGVNYANSLGNNNGAIITSELGEELEWEFMNGGMSWAQAYPLVKEITRSFHQGYTDTMQNNNGIARGMVNNYGEYSGVGGLNALGTPSNAALVDQNAARHVNGGLLDYVNNYNSNNITLRLYLQSLSDLGGGLMPQQVYSILKLRKGFPDRDILVFSWTEIQDLYSIVTQNHMGTHRGMSYRFSSPPGWLYVEAGLNLAPIPAYVALQISFLAALLTKGIVIWDSNDGIKRVPIDGHQKSVFGRREWNGEYNRFHKHVSRMWWHPDGGSLGEYIINSGSEIPGKPGSGWYTSGASGQPAFFDDASDGGFSYNPLTSTDGFYVGFWLWYQISQYIGRLKWGKYSRDGGSTWYTPPSGTDGTHVDMYGQPNYSVNNAIVDVINNKTPMVWTGAANGKKSVIWLNTYLKPHQTDNARIDIDGTVYNLGQLQGTIPHCFIID